MPLYAWLASRHDRRSLINRVTVFFAACLAAFYFLAVAGVPVAIAFYLWVGIFNLMVPAQFWAFANDLYTPEAGKRLFVIVAFGASSGAVFGSFIAGHLIEPVGIYQLLLVSAGVLLASLGLTHLVDSRERRPAVRQRGGRVPRTQWRVPPGAEQPLPATDRAADAVSQLGKYHG